MGSNLYIEWNKEARELDKKNKKDWYTKGGYEYIAFVPATPGSELMKNIEESIAPCNKIKVKVVEKPGQKLINVLKMSTKKSGTKVRCEDELCLMCSQEKSGNCRTSEILYQIECLDCKAKNIKSIYIGESQKNGMTRGSQHMEDSLSINEKQTKKSVMIRHNISHHNGERATYKMTKLKVFPRQPLKRQAAESALIRKLEKDASVNLINNKREMNTIYEKAGKKMYFRGHP